MSISELADYLSERLKAEGFIVHRYDAFSTQSIYLKLDYGVCNSIRISDHNGKRYLKYRYNIGPGIKKKKKVKDRFERFYFPPKDKGVLVNQILADRELKIRRYGKEKYDQYVQENLQKSQFCKGFWTGAKEVKN